MGIFLSCEHKEEETPVAVAKVIEVQKTPKMVDFEKAISSYGKIQEPQLKQEALTTLIAAAKQYLTDNGQTVDQNAGGNEIINSAMDIHLKKINELRNSKTLK